MSVWAILGIAVIGLILLVVLMVVAGLKGQKRRGGLAPKAAITSWAQADTMPSPSKTMSKLANDAVESGLDSVREIGVPVIPSLWLEKDGKRELMRFAMGTQDWALEAARKKATGAPADRVVIWYYAGVLFDGNIEESIVAECHERGQDDGIAFAQPFRGSGSSVRRLEGHEIPEPFNVCTPYLGAN